MTIRSLEQQGWHEARRDLGRAWMQSAERLAAGGDGRRGSSAQKAIHQQP